MNNVDRHIIGTSFLIDIFLFKYIFKFLTYLDSQLGKNPRICFIGIANGDSLIERLFFKLCVRLYNRNWKVDVITKKNIAEIDSLSQYDFIFVGGGNTIKLIDVFKETGFDELLLKSYNRGIKMGGVSAGILCWFREGITDSTGHYSIVQCLDFLPFSCSPHFNDAERKIFYLDQITHANVCEGYGVSDGEIIHFINEDFYKRL